MRYLLLGLLLTFLGGTAAAQTIDFFFEPDTVWSETGQTFLLSGRIGASAVMRGFTVYLGYDTNRIDLAEPPQPGSLIAGHSGLTFNYFDHPAFEPNVLEIGGTIYGSDLWQGPGELFTVRFTARVCGPTPITAPQPPFFVDGQGGYPTVTFHAALAVVCPATPAAPQQVTISNADNGIVLRWNAVTQDIVGRVLNPAPAYQVLRRPVSSPEADYVPVATVADTMYAEPLNDGAAYHYYIRAVTVP